MYRPAKHITLILAACMAAVWLAASAVVKDSDAAKADYIFLEAANAQAEGKLGDYYMLLRRAAALNPEDPYIAGALAEIEIQMPDSALSADAYQRIRARFLLAPDDDSFANSYVTAARDANDFGGLVEAFTRMQAAHPDRTSPSAFLADTYAAEAQATGNEAYADSAVALYSSLLEKQGFTPYLFARKLSVYAQFDRDSMIHAELAALDKSAPRDPKIQIFIAQCLESLGEGDSALSYLERAEKLDANLPDIYSTRAEVYRTLHNDSAYSAEVEHAIQMPALSFETKFQLWSDYMRGFAADSVKEPEIRRLFKVLEDDHPDEPQLHNMYGSYLQFRNDIPGAIEQFDYSVNLDPENSDSWNMRIGAYASQNKPEEIERVTGEFLAYFPENREMRFLQALSMALQGRSKQGVDSIAALTPQSDQSKYWASAIYEIYSVEVQKTEGPDSAMVYLEKAIAIKSDNYSAMNNLAYIMAENNRDLDRAEMYAMLATASDSSNPTFIDTYAWVLFRKNELEKARAEIDKAMRLLGVLPPQEGERIPEMSDEIRALQLTWELYDHAGDIHYLTGDPDGALEFWEKALESQPDNEIIKKKVTHKAYIAK